MGDARTGVVEILSPHAPGRDLRCGIAVAADAEGVEDEIHRQPLDDQHSKRFPT